MFYEILVFSVPDSANSGHVDAEFPGGLVNEVDEVGELVAAENKVFCNASETLTQHFSYLGETGSLILRIN